MLQLSSRAVAVLTYRLMAPKLSPAAKAAQRHEARLQKLFLRAAREAQDAVPMGALIDALQLPGTGGPLYVLQDVIDMMLEETHTTQPHEPYRRKAQAQETVASVLNGALREGAGAVELCVRAKNIDPQIYRRESDAPRILDAVEQGQAVTASPKAASSAVEQAAGRQTHANLERLQVTGEENKNIFSPHASNRKRDEMPQLPETQADQAAFLRYLNENGVQMKVETVDPRQLMATQAELDDVKVGQIYKYLLEHDGKLRGESGPLFVSKERYIIDGHHRWASLAAYALQHPGVKVPIAVLDVPIGKALDLSDAFSKKAGLGHEGFGAGFRTHAAREKGFEPIIVEDPPPADAPPKPDNVHPWTWVNGQWLWIPTDTADGVPPSLDLEDK